MAETKRVGNLKISFKNSLREGGSLRSYQKKGFPLVLKNTKRIILDDNNLKSLFDQARNLKSADDGEIAVENSPETLQNETHVEHSYFNDHNTVPQITPDGVSSHKQDVATATRYNQMYSSHNDTWQIYHQSSEANEIKLSNELINTDLRASLKPYGNDTFNNTTMASGHRGTVSGYEIYVKTPANSQHDQPRYMPVKRNGGSELNQRFTDNIITVSNENPSLYTGNEEEEIEGPGNDYKFRSSYLRLKKSKTQTNNSNISSNMNYYDNGSDGVTKDLIRGLNGSYTDNDQSNDMSKSIELTDSKYREYVKRANGENNKSLIRRDINDSNLYKNRKISSCKKEEEEEDVREEENKTEDISNDQKKHLIIMNYQNGGHRLRNGYKLYNTEDYTSYDDGYASETTRTSNSSASELNQSITSPGNSGGSLVFKSNDDINFGSNDVDNQMLNLRYPTILNESEEVELERRRFKEEEAIRRKSIHSRLETILKAKVKNINSRTMPNKKTVAQEPLISEASRTLPSKKTSYVNEIHESSNFMSRDKSADIENQVAYRYNDNKYYESSSKVVPKPMYNGVLFSGRDENKALENKATMLSELRKSIISRSAESLSMIQDNDNVKPRSFSFNKHDSSADALYIDNNELEYSLPMKFPKQNTLMTDVVKNSPNVSRNEMLLANQGYSLYRSRSNIEHSSKEKHSERFNQPYKEINQPYKDIKKPNEERNLFDSFPLYYSPRKESVKLPIKDYMNDKTEVSVETDETPINTHAVRTMLKSHLMDKNEVNQNSMGVDQNINNAFDITSQDVDSKREMTGVYSEEQTMNFYNDDFEDMIQRKLSIDQEAPESSILESASFKRNRGETFAETESQKVENIFELSLTQSEYETVKERSESVLKRNQADGEYLRSNAEFTSVDDLITPTTVTLDEHVSEDTVFDDNSWKLEDIETSGDVRNKSMYNNVENDIKYETQNNNTLLTEEASKVDIEDENKMDIDTKPELHREPSITKYYLPEENEERVIKPSEYQIHKFSDRNKYPVSPRKIKATAATLKIDTSRIVPLSNTEKVLKDTATVSRVSKEDVAIALDKNNKRRSKIANVEIESMTKLPNQSHGTSGKRSVNSTEKWSSQIYTNTQVGKINIPVSFQSEYTGSWETVNGNVSAPGKDSINIPASVTDEVSPRPSTPKKSRKFS